MAREALAAASGISLRRIEQLEVGAGRGVRPDTVRRLARVLGCEPGDLVEVVE